MSSVSGQEHASSPSTSLFFVAFDVVVISSPSTSSFFRRFRHHFFRRFRSSFLSLSMSSFFSPGCPAPDPVSCPELPTSVPIFELLHQIFQLLPRPFSNLPRFLPRSMRPAPTRSRRGLPCFTDWHITSKSLSAHSQGAHECVVHDLEVVWVNLEQIPIPLESWPFKFQPCSRLSYLVTYPRPCLTIGQTAKYGTGPDEAHQPEAKIRTGPHHKGRKAAPIRTAKTRDLHQICCPKSSSTKLRL